MSCGIGRRCGLDLALLWLWRRPVATAWIRPLAWELPYAMGAALKRKEKNTKSCEFFTNYFLIFFFFVFCLLLLLLLFFGLLPRRM